MVRLMYVSTLAGSASLINLDHSQKQNPPKASQRLFGNKLFSGILVRGYSANLCTVYKTQCLTRSLTDGNKKKGKKGEKKKSKTAIYFIITESL